MADIPLFEPTQVIPITNSRTATLWQVSVALVALFLVMQYLPHGVEWGLLVLIGVILATPAATQGFADALKWIETGGG